MKTLDLRVAFSVALAVEGPLNDMPPTIMSVCRELERRGFEVYAPTDTNQIIAILRTKEES